MMPLVITGINLIAIIAIWNFLIKGLVLDHHRDRLFDLRHKVRAYFIENHSLEHPIYKEIRILINNQINMMESITITKYIYWSKKLSENSALKAQIDQDFSERFRCRSEELTSFLRDVRRESSEICVSYMVCSSFWLLALSLAGASVILMKMVLRDLKRHTLKSASSEAKHFKKINRRSRVKMFEAKTIEEASALSDYYCAC